MSYLHTMTVADLRNTGLYNQQIAESHFTTPDEVVRHMAAMQAQEYALAKWAIGLRMPKATNDIVEDAFNTGKVLRTHVLRPTWHFVAPEDIRWMLQLTAQRVQAFNAPYYRKVELDTKTLNRSANIVAKSLEGQNYLTRKELQSLLQKSKIEAEGLRLTSIMMYAELEGVICSGPRKGNQFTYALMDERVPAAKEKSRDAALSELTIRYFSTRGLATVNDFAWWSGLTVKDCKQGIAMAGSELTSETINEVEYFLKPVLFQKSKAAQGTFLMPDYDEYGISYKDRSAIFDHKRKDELNRPGSPVFNHMLVIDGEIAGTWKRITKGSATTAEASPYEPLNATKAAAVKKAVKRFDDFMKG